MVQARSGQRSRRSCRNTAIHLRRRRRFSQRGMRGVASEARRLTTSVVLHCLAHLLDLKDRMSQAQPARYGARNEESVERGQAIAPSPQGEKDSPEKLYLDLMKKCLTRIAFPERYAPIKPPR